MRFCEKHWNDLRTAVDERGLTPLITRNGEEAVQRVLEELHGTAGEASWDPLMACHWMIIDRAVESLGLYLLSGETCPVCEVVRAHPQPCPNGCSNEDVERDWIQGPADAALRHVQHTPVLSAMLAQEQ